MVTNVEDGQKLDESLRETIAQAQDSVQPEARPKREKMVTREVRAPDGTLISKTQMRAVEAETSWTFPDKDMLDALVQAKKEGKDIHETAGKILAARRAANPKPDTSVVQGVPAQAPSAAPSSPPPPTDEELARRYLISACRLNHGARGNFEDCSLDELVMMAALVGNRVNSMAQWIANIRALEG